MTLSTRLISCTHATTPVCSLFVTVTLLRLDVKTTIIRRRYNVDNQEWVSEQFLNGTSAHIRPIHSVTDRRQLNQTFCVADSKQKKNNVNRLVVAGVRTESFGCVHHRGPNLPWDVGPTYCILHQHQRQLLKKARIKTYWFHSHTK